MSEKILVVVDMQKDFINGTLGTKEAEEIVEKVGERIENFDGEIVFTKDTHFEDYMQTNEGKHLPVIHCIKGSDGWMLDEEIEKRRKPNMKVFEKHTFGSVELGEYIKSVKDVKEVEMVGLCTDICVISNALLIKAFSPEINVSVRADCCAGVTVESHNNAIRAMKMCQIEIV